MGASLIERAWAGDTEAFDLLVRERIDGVYRTAIGILGNSADARDATQDALLSTWRSMGSLRDVDNFDAWLHRITVNAAKKVARRRRVRELPIADEFDVLSDASDVSVTDFDQAFNQLTVDQRALILHHHQDGLSVAELSAQLGIPEGTVKSRLHAARSVLDRALSENRT